MTGRKQMSLLPSRRARQSVGSSRLVSVTLIPGKVMEQRTLESICKHMKGKMVIGSSQPGFAKGQFCLTKLTALYNEVTSLLDEGRAVDVVCLGLSTVFMLSYVTSSETNW